MADPNIDSAKRNRKVLRQRITCMLSDLQTLLGAATIGDADTEPLALAGKLQSKREALLEKAKSLAAVDLILLDSIEDDDELLSETTAADEYADRVNSATHHAEAVIRKLHAPVSVVSTSPDVGATGAPAIRSDLREKLPKLEFPSFDGDLTLWMSWWERFEASVHSKPDLSDLTKFSYLKSFLKQKALASINGIAVTASNYQVAIRTLTDRFGKPDAVADAHFRKLADLKQLKTGSYTELCALVEDITANRAGLLALGGVDQYSRMLFSILRRTLNEPLRLRYSDSKFDDNLDGLVQFLAAELGRLEEQGCTIDPCPTPSEKDTGGSGGKTNMVATLYNAADPKNLYCVFCDNATHMSEACRSSMSREDRRTILMQKGRCFRCYAQGHLSKQCSVRVTCQTCKGRHQTLLCMGGRLKKSEATKTTAAAAAAPATPTTEATTPSTSTAIQTVAVIQATHLLNTFRATISNPTSQGESSCRGLLDSGSTRSFILTALSRALDLPRVGREVVDRSVFGGVSESVTCQRVYTRIRNSYTGEHIDIELLEIDEICHAIPHTASSAIMGYCMDKCGMPADYAMDTDAASDGRIQVLFGSDFRPLLMCDEAQRLTPRIRAEKTIFGWVLEGPDANLAFERNIAIQNMVIQSSCLTEPKPNELVQFQTDDADEPPHADTEEPEALKDIWALEQLGLGNDILATQPSAAFPEPAFKDGSFVVGLPWKPGYKNRLANNYEVAVCRLHSLRQQLIAQDRLTDYQAVLTEYLEHGIIEPVPPAKRPQGSYYLPHHAIIREERTTTKLRIVFDASSHAKNQLSLNDCLWSGPDLLNNMFAILLRFRRGPVATTSDIEKAFLQILLDPADRDSVRFLWLPKPNTPLQEYRFTRVIFGVTSSPAHLNATLKCLIGQWRSEYPQAVEALDQDLYMDDFITSVDTVEEAEAIHEQSCAVLQSGGFALKKWTSNSHVLRQKWNGNDTTTVLGLQWDTKLDTIAIAKCPTSLPSSTVPTKREVLQHLSELYDPLGLAAPFAIRAKMLMQDIWRLCLGWDVPIPVHLSDGWHKWTQEAQQIPSLRMPRAMTLTAWNPEYLDFHLFVDASTKAFAAVVFVLQRLPEQPPSTSLVACKARVAPLKTVSLPRLELLAAVIGVRLWHAVCTALKLVEPSLYCWTDSRVTLAWIHAGIATKDIFVANRVAEIRDHTAVEQWRHCPGSLNPADAPSRGVAGAELESWWKGPEWLGDPKNWPSQTDSSTTETPSTDDTVVMLNFQSTTAQPKISDIIDIHRFSNYSRLIRATAWVSRFVHNCKKGPKLEGPLSQQEWQEAEIRWVSAAQRECFDKELRCTRKSEAPESSSALRQYQLQLDPNDLLVIKSRLPCIEEPITPNPIILPAKHRLTLLLVRWTHLKHLHAGVATSLSILRRQFWIHAGRRMVRDTIKDCTPCKRVNGRPLVQTAGQLPAERTTWARPFAVTGIDFAGPLSTKDADGSIKKTYICLFTCAVTRAIHLELVSSLTTEAFLLCLRRFLNRRGVCNTIYTDNASTFKRANKVLKQLHKLCTQAEVQDYATQSGIKWKFIVERAPWWGGFWERMVKSVKITLKCTIQRNCLSYEELSTVLTEVESVINTRPLAQLNDDPNEARPLTPAHLLAGTDCLSLPTFLRSGEVNPNKVPAIQEQWRDREIMVDTLRRRWVNEYLGQLKSAHQAKQTPTAVPKVGDVVILAKENTPQLHWPLARILELRTGRDGHIRSGKLRLANGTEVMRPIQLLIPLEEPGEAGNVRNSDDTKSSNGSDREDNPRQQEEADDSKKNPEEEGGEEGRGEASPVDRTNERKKKDEKK